MQEEICRIPISATIRKVGGEMELVSAHWEEIPADVIAQFLIKKFGVTPIFGGGEDDC